MEKVECKKVQAKPQAQSWQTKHTSGLHTSIASPPSGLTNYFSITGVIISVYLSHLGKACGNISRFIPWSGEEELYVTRQPLREVTANDCTTMSL
ncbi:hypothetical protein J6590_035860 [Homalodisca vitripennis]|nr:hypothetical protein J6590_035860 [Homalodisca vitripennis]